MKSFFNLKIISLSLAIFSMFFGAGNLMFPIMVGLMAGDKTFIAIAAFMVTAIVLPLLGLITMILFDGNYEKYFDRIGTVAGKLMLLISMFVIGPVIVMPRIVTLSYTMMEPFLPNISIPLFGAIFLTLSYVATIKKGKIMDILGYIISPILVISLLIIIIKGYITGTTTHVVDVPLHQLVVKNITYGYKTLDVLGSVFFASIILTILKKNFAELGQKVSQRTLAIMSLKAGAIGTTILGLIYLGLSYLGTYFGTGLANSNEGELFRAISFRVLGNYGTLVISVAVLMACFSTIIALGAIVADYIHRNPALSGKVSYGQALFIVLGATFVTSNFGLSAILKFSSPIITIGYPVFLTLTLCNLAYKLFNFKPVKLPVLIVLIISLITYFQ